jgi:hypothetical protein
MIEIFGHIFFALGGFFFASTVLAGKHREPSGLYAVGAWACGSIWMVLIGRELDQNFLLSSVAQAGIAFLGWRFGIWLGLKGES